MGDDVEPKALLLPPLDVLGGGAEASHRPMANPYTRINWRMKPKANPWMAQQTYPSHNLKEEKER